MKKFCVFVALCSIILLSACKSKQASSSPSVSLVPVGPVFVADSAFAYCQAQCEFGPRSMNSDAHEKCAQWIVSKFEQFGCKVTTQDAMLTGYDGTALKSKNIIASYRPSSMGVSSQEGTEGGLILLCAHWDSRPWADNDPDEANWHKPVMAANDGASGVAVMLELARLLQQNDSARMTVDFICFDAEDWGVPQWSDEAGADSWALGAQYWAANPAPLNPKDYQFGILLDMVGGQGAKFYREYYSMRYARNVVERVWQAANAAGYGSVFPYKDGGGVTDDHLPVNEKAGIPCIDIINHYPDCEQSSFGPTWHTINDDMQHLDRNTLQAVGQTLVQLIYSE